MISADLHTHTLYSHARDSAAAMYAAAIQKGLTCFGFSEHSPRPEKYTYTHEYRDKLNAHLPDYVRDVGELKRKGGACRVLLGMEIDWFENDQAFVRTAATQFPFDYLIGSVHFLGTWGFDDNTGAWDKLTQSQREIQYRSYFMTWRKMLDSGLFNIAAHPDLIKIYSVDSFHLWLAKEENLRLICDCLQVLRQRNMAMEISSAGIRKPCREIYPCAAIMRLASEVGVRISFASDAHTTEDVAGAFPRLASYARAFGFTQSVLFDRGNCESMEI